MQQVKAIEDFTDDAGDGFEVVRKKDVPFAATNERADQLAERGLVRKLSPAAEKRAEEKADAPKE